MRTKVSVNRNNANDRIVAQNVHLPHENAAALTDVCFGECGQSAPGEADRLVRAGQISIGDQGSQLCERHFLRIAALAARAQHGRIEPEP